MNAELESSLVYISEFQDSQGLETKTLSQENHKNFKKLYFLRLYQSFSFFEII